MENIKNLQNLPNYNTYLSELMSAVAKEDQNTINHIFNKIDIDLKKRRKEMSVTLARDTKMWINPESYFKAVQSEEIFDLKMEFDDNLGLFQLASLIKYKPVMIIEFAKMIQNLNDVRQRTNIRIERNKIIWDDPKSHFEQVQNEEIQDLNNEILDLKLLYDIAKSLNFDEGIELISNRLNKIAPNLVDSLTSKNDSTIRK